MKLSRIVTCKTQAMRSARKVSTIPLEKKKTEKHVLRADPDGLKLRKGAASAAVLVCAELAGLCFAGLLVLLCCAGCWSAALCCAVLSALAALRWLSVCCASLCCCCAGFAVLCCAGWLVLLCLLVCLLPGGSRIER